MTVKCASISKWTGDHQWSVCRKKSVEDFLNYCNFFGNCKSNSSLVCLAWFPIPGTIEPRNLKDHFTILQKCKNKLDCLLYETLYIGDLDPALNT